MSDGAGLTPQEVLDVVAGANLRELSARNCKLIMATAWVDQHPPEAVDPTQLSIPGGDRPLRLGGDGTPAIANFSVPEFAVTLRRSRRVAELMIADALDLRHRLPRLWARVCANEIEGADAQLIARETRHLLLPQALEVDQHIADSVGRLSWARLMRKLRAEIIRVDAERIAAVAEELKTRTGVTLGKIEDGFQTMELRAPAPLVLWVVATINRLASIQLAKGDQRALGERQVAAMESMTNPLLQLQLLAEDESPTLFDVDLDGLVDYDSDDKWSSQRTPQPESEAGPNPASSSGPAASAECDSAAVPGDADQGDTESHTEADQGGVTHPSSFPRIEHDRELARLAIEAIRQLDPAKLRPAATLYVHIATETLQQGLGVTRVEDVGPVISSLVGEWLQTCDLTVKPVIDLNADATPVDAYELPRAMRERMFLKRPASVFPYSAAANRRMDLDHSAPYREGASRQTREDNLGPLTRREHNVITHGDWKRRQPEPGSYLFRAPHGRVFLVNAAGTTDLGQDQLARLIWHATTPED